MSIKREIEKMELNLDLNDLFTFTYSFDTLKKTLEAMYNNQLLLANKIKNIEDKKDHLTSYRSNNHEYNQSSGNNNNNPNPYINNHRNKSNSCIIRRHQCYEIQSEETALNDYDAFRPKSVKDNRGNMSRFFNRNIQQETIQKNTIDSNNQKEQSIISAIDNMSIKSLENKVKSLSRKIKAIENASSQYNNNNTRSNELNSTIKYDIEALKEKDIEIENKLIDMNQVLDEIKVKVLDFNIFELFKSTNDKGGNIDLNQAVYQSLEQKVFKKFSLIDEKQKMNDYDIVKSKNDVSNTKIQLEGFIYSTNILITDLTQRLTDTEKNHSDTLDDLNDLNDQLTSLIDKINKQSELNIKETLELKQVNDEINKQLEEFNKRFNDISFNKETFVTEQVYSKFKEAVLKKVHDIDHKFYEVNPIERFRQSEKRIQEINDKIKEMPAYHEIAIINDKVLTLTKKLDYSKEFELNMSDSITKFRKEMMGLNKKMEYFHTMISAIKNTNPASSSASPQVKKEIDLSKYLELNTFNDFFRFYQKEKEKNHKELEDLNAVINELKGDMKEKASEYDMKRVEEYLLAAMDEFKKGVNIKYVDRIELSKTFKLIEHQIRHIMDILSQKKKRTDNWLLATKPLGGHNCASCEAFIGDLNTSNEFLPWNKVSGKEPIDIIGLRTGNGFSRILSMVNIKNKKDNDNVGSEEKKNSNSNSETEANKGKKAESRNSKKKNKKIQLDNQTVDDAKHHNSETNKELHCHTYHHLRISSDNNEPKVMKIVKKKKLNKDKDTLDNY